MATGLQQPLATRSLTTTLRHRCFHLNLLGSLSLVISHPMFASFSVFFSQTEFVLVGRSTFNLAHQPAASSGWELQYPNPQTVINLFSRLCPETQKPIKLVLLGGR